MSDSLRLFFRYIGISLRGQMQYRASFIMLTLGQCLITGIEIMAIWVLFNRFGSLQGWRLAEVALFYGIIHISFAIAEGIGRGFDLFSGMVKSGDFDRLLLRPRSTAFQVAASEVQAMRVGRLIQGLIVLVWASIALEIHWSMAKLALLMFSIFGCACLFYGLFVLQATVAFWTTESLELMSILTYGGTEAGQFPIPIYRRWFQRLFTFVVPLACVTYFPALGILGRRDVAIGSPGWFHWIAPVVGVLFLLICLQAWKFGVRHYRSTGS